MYRGLLNEIDQSNLNDNGDNHCNIHCRCEEIVEHHKRLSLHNGEEKKVYRLNNAPPKQIIATVLNKLAERTSSSTPEEAQNISVLEMNRITAPQKEIIKRTFALMEKDAVKNALIMLVKLFSEHPRYKNVWPQFRAIPDSALMHAVELKRHASVYMAGLAKIIEAMDDDTALAEQLKRIARAHIKWNIHKTHIMHMLEPVLEVVALSNGITVLDNATKDAWTTLYDVIANLIYYFKDIERRDSLSKASM